MRKVTAEEIAAKKAALAVGTPPVKPILQPQGRVRTPDKSPHPYELANQIPTADVCAAYGLGDGKVSCPICKNAGDWVNKGGFGFKCFHNTCHQFSADNLGLVAAVRSLGDTKGDGEPAKANKRNAYNDLRTTFPNLPELIPTKEERAARARERLAGMDIEEVGEAREEPSQPAPPPNAVRPATEGASAINTSPETPNDNATAKGSTSTKAKRGKVDPDLAKIRARLAVLVDLPVDEREAEFTRLLNVYKTTRVVLRATLHELELEGRKHRQGDVRKPEPWEQQLLTRPTPWGAKLERNAHNIMTILRHEKAFAGALQFDVFAERIMIVRSCPACLPTDAYPLPWSDVHDVRVAAWLQSSGHRLDVGSEQVANAVPAVALEHRVHPLKERLVALKWDRGARLDTWLPTYLGAPDTAYTRDIGAKWMISAVARIMQPGCKADHVLVLEGVQGARKSTAVRTLSYGYFTDEIADLGSKDAAMQLHGVWIVEFAELDAIGRADVSRQKQFVTKTFDRYRAPYGRHVADHPRQCVFVGTVNKGDYLKDETGGRRWWPVACGKIDLAALDRDRDQIWAEAMSRFEKGDPWWLASGEATARAEEEQANRYQGDAWDSTIEEYVDGEPSATIEDILQQGFNIAKKDWGQPEQNRVARCLKRLGWTRKQVRLGNGSRAREWRYFPPVPTPPVSPVAIPTSGDTGSTVNQALVPSVPSKDEDQVGDFHDESREGERGTGKGTESVGGLNEDGGNTGDTGDKSHFLDKSGVPTPCPRRPKPGTAIAVEEHVLASDQTTPSTQSPQEAVAPNTADAPPPASLPTALPPADPTAVADAVLDRTILHGRYLARVLHARGDTGRLDLEIPFDAEGHIALMAHDTQHRGDDVAAYARSITDEFGRTVVTFTQTRVDGNVTARIVRLERRPSRSSAPPSATQTRPAWGWVEHHASGREEWSAAEPEKEVA
jgi:predicted P-loop ATPase